jgi:2-hydroxychromene-2-carboxylate isomerase
MMPKVEFLFDFGSPNAYLAHKVVPGIEARSGARFEYVPILLGGIFKLTGNRSPMEAFAGIKNKREFMRIEMGRFIRKHAISAFQLNPHFPVNTLTLMRMAAAASIDGGLAPLVEAAFHHMWEEPKKMDDPAVLQTALAASGLDAERLLARSQDVDAKTLLMASTERAVARGAFGAPTFFVGDEMFYGKDQLRDVEEEIVARASAGS